MKTNHYFTFGQQYAYEPHPTYPKAHPNGWVTIVAEDHGKAREKAFELFGSRFATSYQDREWDPKWFPMGEIERIEI